MKNKKLLWIIIGLVILIVALIAFKKTGVLGKDEGENVTVEPVSRKTIIETVNGNGKISTEIEVKVSPDISGEIVELNVNEGDSVQKGQVVARIYADIYASQKDQAAAGVAQSEAQEANSKAQLSGLEAVLSQAQTNYNRQKKLYDEKVISKSELEQAEQSLRTAQSNLNAAKEGLKANKAAIQSAQANLNRASKDMNRATIVAPMSGVINSLSVKKGERVSGNSFSLGTEMMRIADLSSIVAIVDVSENDIPKVKFGDTAMVTVEAYSNRKFKGVVFKIANPISGNAVAATTEVTNYKVHIRLIRDSYADLIGNGHAFPFRPNMTANADIQTRTERNVMAVPLTAVTIRDKKMGKANTTKSTTNDNTDNKTINADDVEEVVFIVDSNSVKKVVVKHGIQDLTHIQITTGLKGTEKVITGPYSLLSKTLKEGDKVKVVEKEHLYDNHKSN